MAIEFEEISGLYLIPSVFTDDESKTYCDIIEKESHNKCPQIHLATEYGWKFVPPIKKTIDDYLGDYPKWLNDIWDRTLYNINCHINKFPNDIIKSDHALINQYIVGDGCKDHYDDINFWTNWVIGVSFGSGCTMKFTNIEDSKEIHFYLPKNSIYIMMDDARYKWNHGIPFQKEDIFYGTTIKREKRVSITFRAIKKEYLPY
jgi:hypothetical protein